MCRLPRTRKRHRQIVSKSLTGSAPNADHGDVFKFPVKGRRCSGFSGRLKEQKKLTERLRIESIRIRFVHMNIGVLGSGDVAKTLGAGFLKHGHQVTMGTRETAKLADWAKENPGASLGSFQEAASFGDVLVLGSKVMP